jgi:hypothetical protein
VDFAVVWHGQFANICGAHISYPYCLSATTVFGSLDTL